LGNYLGYGASVAATIDELLDFRCRALARPDAFACDVVFLRGAQEEMWQKLLQLQFAQNPGEVLEWMVREGVEATVKAFGGEMRGLVETEFAVSLDAGAGRGGPLLAAAFAPDGTVLDLVEA